MKQGGWIKIHRKMVDWEWYSHPTTFVVWMHLLIEATHEEKEWKGVPISIGQLVTSVNSLAISTGLSIQQVRTALRNIQTTGEITIKTTNKYSIITICKYDEYQLLNGKGQQTKQQTNNKQTNNILINKEDKEVKSLLDKSRIPPTLEEVELFNSLMGYGINSQQFVAFYESKDWYVGKNKMKDWQAALRGWAMRSNKESNNKTNRRSTDVPTNPDYTKPF